MRNIPVASIAELEAVLRASPAVPLFRGQTKHYGGTDSPAMSASFDRKGCVPDTMLRWTHYAHGALKYLLGKPVDSIPFLQAVLQHYGWRSFYLDLSSDPAVAAWFAAHDYDDGPAGDLCEDCFEDPMMLVRKQASYAFTEGTGHLYVLDAEMVAARGIGLHDLADMPIRAERPRFRAQAAWLAGPTRGNLPIECFHTRILAPRAVFRDFALSRGFGETADLFPPPAEDPVLAILLDLPWQEARLPGEEPDSLGIPFFRRALEIPEYHDGFVKHQPPHRAFYRGGKLAEEMGRGDAPVLCFRAVPEIVIFGSARQVPSGFPHVMALLREEPNLAFEIDCLVRLAETGASTTYGKGIAVLRRPDGLVMVADLVADHPGMELAGGGVNAGWYYRIDEEGAWTRELTEEDCPCGDPERHRRHLSVLTILDDWLGNPAAYG